MTEYTFFSSTHGTFSRTDYIMEQKTSHNDTKVEIIPTVSSKHNGMKLEIKYKKKDGKTTYMWRLNNILLNYQVNEKIRYQKIYKNENVPWLVWLSGLSAGLQTKGSLV